MVSAVRSVNEPFSPMDIVWKESNGQKMCENGSAAVMDGRKRLKVPAPLREPDDSAFEYAKGQIFVRHISEKDESLLSLLEIIMLSRPNESQAAFISAARGSSTWFSPFWAKTGRWR